MHGHFSVNEVVWGMFNHGDKGKLLPAKVNYSLRRCTLYYDNSKTNCKCTTTSYGIILHKESI